MAAEELNLDDPLGSFAGTWQRVVLEPRPFFAALPHAGGLQAPLVFAAISLFLGGIGVLVFGGGLRGLVALLARGVLRLFVAAAIIVLVGRNLFDGKGDYESTFRAISYSTAIVVFIGIPIVKYVAALYGCYLTILAIERAQTIDAVRATLTFAATAITGFVLAYALGLWPRLATLNPLL